MLKTFERIKSKSMALLVLLIWFSIPIQSLYSQGRYIGADINVAAADIKDPKKVRVTITYYRDCAPNRNTTYSLDSVLINFQSNECCVKYSAMIPFVPSLSGGYATPVCQSRLSDPGLTKCVNPQSEYIAYRKEVYQRVITLPDTCSDWHVSHNLANKVPGPGNNDLLSQTAQPRMVSHAAANSRQNLFDNPPMSSQTWNYNVPPVLPQVMLTTAPMDYYKLFGANIANFLNMENYDLQNQVNLGNSSLYIEAWYSNKIEVLDAVNNPTYYANNMPVNIIDMPLFQCNMETVVHDLGFYDPDGDILKFRWSAPFSDMVNSGFLDKFVTNGKANNYNLGANCSKDMVMCAPMSISIIDSNTGVMTIRPMQTGQYKASIRIEEYDRQTLQLKGISYRDFAITVVRMQECASFPNTMSNNGVINPTINVLSGGQISNGTTNVVEVCQGNSLQLQVRAVNLSTTPPFNLQVPQLIVKMPAQVSSTGGFGNYTPAPNVGSSVSTFGNFSWNVPQNMPAGMYPIIFEIEDCLASYQFGKYLIVYVKVLDPVKIKALRPQALSPEIIYDIAPQAVFSPDSMTFCKGTGAINRWLEADNGTRSGVFTWSNSNPSTTQTSEFSFGDKQNAILVPENLTQKTCFYVQSDQFCNNRDTFCVDVDDPRAGGEIISAEIDSFYDENFGKFLKNQCYGDQIKLRLEKASSLDSVIWFTKNDVTSFSADNDNPGPFYRKASILESVNQYYAMLVSKKNCAYIVSKTIPSLGIKPTLKLSTDKVNVCPLDTIQIRSEITVKGYCGQDLSELIPTSAETFSNITRGDYLNIDTGIAKVFNAKANSRFMHTQVLYRGNELACYFKAGKIKQIGFSIKSLGNPRFYDNFKVKISCTNRDNLDNKTFSDLTDVPYYYETKSLETKNGLTNLVLDKEFFWDGESNLIFEFFASCVYLPIGLTASQPILNSDRTDYTSVLGFYSKDYLPDWETRSARDTSIMRPNLYLSISPVDSSKLTFRWTPQSGLFTPTISSPKVSTDKRTMYKMTAVVTGRDNSVSPPRVVENCFFKDSIEAKYEDSFKVRLSSYFIEKCGDDTVRVTASAAQPLPVKRLLDFKLYDESDGCKPYDSSFSGRTNVLVLNPVTGNNLSSPFGFGSAVNSSSNARKTQYIITRNELKNMHPGGGISQLLINSIGVNLLKQNNPNIFAAMRNFQIRVTKTRLDSFPTNKLVTFSPCEESVVYQSASYKSVQGLNIFKFSKPYGFHLDSAYNLLVEICWQNVSSQVYFEDIVESTQLPSSRTLSIIGVNNNKILCSDSFVGTKYIVRPNFYIDYCIPNADVPPVAREFIWIPSEEISNTRVRNPLLYPSDNRQYRLMVEYKRDKLDDLGKVIGDTLVCRVRDSVQINVFRPEFKFQPENPKVCLGSSLELEVVPEDPNIGNYVVRWDDNQPGFDVQDTASFFAIVSPRQSRYYKVKLSQRNNPFCYRYDSIWVNVESPRIMPNTIFGVSQICEGDSTTLSLPSEVGYNNPQWYRIMPGGVDQILGNGYKLTIKDTGRYYVSVDSGACRNISGSHLITYRAPDTLKYSINNVQLCQGDSVLVSVSLSSGLQNPQWNDGVRAVNRYVKSSGLYYIINSVGANSCKLYQPDSLKVIELPNPDFKLQNDTICIGIDKSVTLIPDPLDLSALYSWTPNGVNSPTLTVRSPGTYKVVRINGNCTKEARAVVIPDYFGQIILTADSSYRKAVCCDEIVELNANPNNFKYVSTKWSTGATSEILYTEPNKSGLYYVESVKPSGCKDTGSIFIENKCINLIANVSKDTIQLGETVDLIGYHRFVNDPSILYRWVATPTNTKITNYTQLNAIGKPLDSGDIEFLLVSIIEDSSYNPPKRCTENTVVRIRVIGNKLTIPNVFTPNGDGKNDKYYPQIEGVADIVEFKIYNRFGQLVHDNPKEPWDGTLDGQPQPVGVYVCLLSIKINEHGQEDKIMNQQINLTLLR